MVVGEVTGIQTMRTGTLFNILIKDKTGRCNAYYLISEPMRNEILDDKIKQLTYVYALFFCDVSDCGFLELVFTYSLSAIFQPAAKNKCMPQQL